MAMIDQPGARRPRISLRSPWAVRISQVPALLRLTLPITCVCLANMAMSITDTMMAAWFGTEALAAVAVGSDYCSIAFYLLTGVIAGLAPAYGAASAANDTAGLKRLRTAGWLVTLGPATMMVPVIWFAPTYLARIGIDATILETGTGYIHAMAFTLLPMAVLSFMRTRLTAIEQPGAILGVTLLSIPVNAGLNALFMFGVAGWPGLGVTGAGVASLATASFMAAMLMVQVWKHGDHGAARVIDWAMVRETLRVGLPIAITTLAELGVYLGATLYVAGFGPDATAAHAVTIRMAGLTYALIAGLSQASTVRLARSDPEGGIALRRDTVRAAAVLAIAAGVILPAFLVVAAVVGLTALPAMGLSAAASETAFWLLLILAATEIVEPAGSTASGLMRGRSDTKVPMVFALAGNWAIGVPAGLVLSTVFGLGAVGVWTGLFLGLTAAAVPTIARVRRHL